MGLSLTKMTESERIEIAKGLFEVSEEDHRKGELHGKCPLHDEDNPSFSYNYKKDSYHCLACLRSGDLIKLWSRVNGYSDNTDGFKAFCSQFDIHRNQAAPRVQGNRQGNAGAGAGQSPPASRKPAKEKASNMPDLDAAFAMLGPLPEARAPAIRAVACRGRPRPPATGTARRPRPGSPRCRRT